jgi:hypothetical protein
VELLTGVVDPTSGPAYQPIADELRRRIRSGAVAPGSKLPTYANDRPQQMSWSYYH